MLHRLFAILGSFTRSLSLLYLINEITLGFHGHFDTLVTAKRREEREREMKRRGKKQRKGKRNEGNEKERGRDK